MRRTLVTLVAFEAAYGWQPALVEVRVFPTLVTGQPVPCGVRNVGGCAYPGGPLFVAGDLDGLFHELNHLRLFSLGDPAWTAHAGPQWDAVNKWVPPW